MGIGGLARWQLAEFSTFVAYSAAPTASGTMSFDDADSGYANPADRSRTASDMEAASLTTSLQVPSSELQQRHDNILTIENQLQDVNEMAGDIAIMVNADKHKVVAIGQNIDDTAGYTQGGHENLSKAVSGRSWKQRFCCVLLALLTIFNTIMI